jgi:YD repeat-containing protein
MDFDGDARIDIVRPSIVSSEPQAAEWKVNINNAGAGPGPEWWASPAMKPGQNLLLTPNGRPSEAVVGVDLDGDGAHDIININSHNGHYRRIAQEDGNLVVQQFSTPSLKHAVFVDMNGDGLKDAVVPSGFDYDPHEPPWPLPPLLPARIYTNTGNGFLPEYQSLNVTWGYYSRPTVRVADFDGDGREDLLLLHTRDDLNYEEPFSGPEVAYLWLSTGRDFEQFELPFEVRGRFLQGYLGWQGLSVGDVNGDGKPDIIGPGLPYASPQLAWCGPYTYEYWCIKGFSLNVAAQPDGGDDRQYDLLVEVTDGLGAVEHVSYDQHAPHGVGDNDPIHVAAATCNFPERCAIRGAPLVTLHRIEDPLDPASDREWAYRYFGGRIDVRGRGFIGYERVVRTDSATGAVVETTYDLGRHEDDGVVYYPLASRPAHRKTLVALEPGKSLLTVEEFHEDVSWLGNRYLVRPVSRTTRIYENGSGTPSREDWVVYNHYDGYGNAWLITSWTVGGFSQVVNRTLDNRVSDWLLGLPTKMAVSSDAPGFKAVTRTTDYKYDARGLVESVDYEPGGGPDLELHISSTRNTAGLVTAETVVDATHTSVTTTDYDVDQVYPVKETNDLGHESHFAFHPGLDRLVAASNANCAVIEWGYDAVGRLVRTAAADGSWADVEYLANGPMTVKTTYADGNSKSSASMRSAASGAPSGFRTTVSSWPFTNRSTRLVASRDAAFPCLRVPTPAPAMK